MNAPSLRLRSSLMAAALATLLTWAPALQAQIEIPSGWEQQTRDGVFSLSPKGLGNQVFMVVRLDPLPMQGLAPAQWLQQTAAQLSQSYGRVDEAGTPVSQQGLWSTTDRLHAGGKALVVTYVLRVDEQQRARLAFMISEQDQELLVRYGTTGAQLMGQMIAGDAPSATARAPAEKSPEKPANTHTGTHTGKAPQTRPGDPHDLSHLRIDGVRIGGDFTYGQYHCKVENGKSPYEVTLDLYPNKELRTSMRRLPTDTYKFDAAKGTVEIDNHIYLVNWEDYNDEPRYWALYFRDGKGQAYLYGHNARREEGTLCRHVGASSHPSPSDEKAQRAEAQRFKWVTQPGEGVPLRQIEAILHTAEHVSDGRGMRLEEEHLLLLKDGWAYDGLRVSPHDLDARASRENEPKRWRRWRKKGGGYQLEKNGQWEDAPGSAVRPAKKDERLHGAYTASSFHGSAFTSGFAFQDTLYFDKDGTLSSGSTTRGGTGVMNSGTYSATVGADRRDKTPLRYRLEGYTLERQGQDGKTHRSLFFFWGSKDKEKININGTTYSP